MESKLVQEIEKIRDEYEKDIQFDEFNLREMQLKIPALKSKWSAKLSINEALLYEWKEKRDLVFEAILKEIQDKSDMPLTKTSSEIIVKRDHRYKKVVEKIKTIDIINKFLERIDRNIQSVTWDMKNILDELKIENT
jgi:hypothetical protein